MIARCMGNEAQELTGFLKQCPRRDQCERYRTVSTGDWGDAWFSGCTRKITGEVKPDLFIPLRENNTQEQV